MCDYHEMKWLTFYTYLYLMPLLMQPIRRMEIRCIFGDIPRVESNGFSRHNGYRHMMCGICNNILSGNASRRNQFQWMQYFLWYRPWISDSGGNYRFFAMKYFKVSTSRRVCKTNICEISTLIYGYLTRTPKPVWQHRFLSTIFKIDW